MNALFPYQGWDEGGPTVFHSEWWLRAHWGRPFDFVELRPGANPGEHGVALMRKRPISLTKADLEEPDPYEPREKAAAEHELKAPGRRFERLRSRLRL